MRSSRGLMCAVLLCAAWNTVPAFGQAAGADAGMRADENAHALPMDRGAAGLWQMLLKLHTRASLMMFTAHPDDEDGGMLTYESRALGAETTLYTLNRGEGGQNLMSSEFWDELGLVRTEELEAADRYYGARQRWGTVADFGFTKTKEEALDKWGNERVLGDSVRAVREMRPLVVASVFAGNVSDGHGQHQVAGEMAQEVFNAAGDPKRFPEQIRAGLRLWAPRKVYVRLPFANITSQGVFDYATGHWAPARFKNYVDGSSIEGRPSATVAIPVGAESGAVGLSYFQIGRLGLGQQKSQNGGIGLPPAGPMVSEYHRYASRVKAGERERSFFDGMDVSLAGIAEAAPVAEQGWIRARLASVNGRVEAAMRGFSAGSPERIAPELAAGLSETEALIAAIARRPLPDDARYDMLHELGVKQRQFNRALVLALGVKVDAVVAEGPVERGYFARREPTFPAAIPGQSFGVNVHVANQGGAALAVTSLRLVSAAGKDWKLAADGAVPEKLEAATAADVPFRVTAPQDAAETRPYFTRPDVEQPYYDVTDDADLGRSEMPYPLAARVALRYRGVEITVEKVVQTVELAPETGPVENPLIVAPAISVWVSPAAGIVPLGSRTFPISAMVHSNVKGPAEGTVRLHLPAGWTAVPAVANFHTEHDGDEREIAFTVRPGRLEAKPYRIAAEALSTGRSYTAGYRMTGYAGLRPYPYYRDAAYRTTGVDVKLPAGLQVGYVSGTGDSVAESLGNLGLRPVLLSDNDLASGDLGRLNAIVLGVRAYAARPELAAESGRLLDYVKNGGTLIVQYNLAGYGAADAPYPLMLGASPEKVIDEGSRVTLLKPEDPALTWPNRITAMDFSGWVEERGHGFPQSWDPRYTALVEMHDPEQTPQRGGLLVARYGKGWYVYDALALYRQLPEGVPGAYRIFANLLSLSGTARSVN